MDATSVFQRTESGRDTIKNKTFKLTQSERLLLIVVDGVTNYEELRKEVWALSEERFNRALTTLLNAGLIFEVMLVLQTQEPEVLDKGVVEHFLRQDPMDPVTIISSYPEDEFGEGDSPVGEGGSSSVPTPHAGLFASGDRVESPAASSPCVPRANELSIAKLAEAPRALSLNDPWPSLVLSPASALLPDQTPQPAPDDWPDEWPEFLAKESRTSDSANWAAWGALAGGILIIVLFVYFQFRH